MPPSRSFLFVDLETSGTDPGRHEILEAAVRMVTVKGTAADTLGQRVTNVLISVSSGTSTNPVFVPVELYSNSSYVLANWSNWVTLSPGTNTGAAHPVTMGGENTKENIEVQKAESDLAAFAR